MALLSENIKYMTNIFLKFSLLLTQLLRTCLLPLLYLLLPFVKFIKARYIFEKSNRLDLYSESFSKSNQYADYLFEVSSEGELEQVLPIINILLKNGKKIELIFSSVSVEAKVLHLAKHHKNSLRILRLNLLFLPLYGDRLCVWATAKVVTLCRYDFYPELFLLGMKRDVEFILVSASLKAKQSKKLNSFSQLLYLQFDKIILASSQEVEKFGFLKIDKSKIGVFDFRIGQISSRRHNAHNIIASGTQVTQELYSWFKTLVTQPKILFGSFWDNEIEAFENKEFLKSIKSFESYVLIAPHSLNRDNAIEINKKLKETLTRQGVDLSIYLIEPTTTKEEITTILRNYSHRPGIFISLIPAVLVEFYGAFDFSFIGGGHGRSIHSVLEPYIMNTQVLCGPKIHRSSEFDIVQSLSPHDIKVVESMDNFFCQVKLLSKISEDEVVFRNEMIENNKIELENIMKGFYYV